MMEIFWTMLASQDRERIREYIAEQNLMAAIELDERIGYSAGSRIKAATVVWKVPGNRLFTPILFWFMKSIASGEKCISCAYCIQHRSGHSGGCPGNESIYALSVPFSQFKCATNCDFSHNK